MHRSTDEGEERSPTLRARLTALVENPPTDEALSRRAIEEAESTERVQGTSTEALVSHAERLGATDPAAAARSLALASIAARREGRARLAVELCLRAAHRYPRTRGLQRAWGLALLAWGDVDGARGHLERWCEEEPDSLDAVLWSLEASLHSRSTLATGPLIERLAELAESCEDRDRSPGRSSLRVLIVDGTLSRAHSLSRILGRWNVHASTVEAQEWFSGRTPRGEFAVLLAPLPLESSAAAAELDRIQALPGLATTPVLGVVRLEVSPPDVYSLRDRGVLGLIDSRANAEHVAFRVAQALRVPGSFWRRSVRVPVDFQVELYAGGSTTLERAENLSCGGLRIRSSRALETNSEVRVRFRLGRPDSQEFSLEGRVSHCGAAAEAADLHSLGIFFLSLEARDRALVEAEVDRLLAAPPEPAVLVA